MKHAIAVFLSLCFGLSACAAPASSSAAVNILADTPTHTISPATTTPEPTLTSTSLPADTPLPTATLTPVPTETATSVPTVESLKAVVTADLLSCRYGPGSEYLFLYGFRKGAKILLIGQTGGNNWVWVDGKNKCWVNAKYIEIEGDVKQLPIVYPDQARLPRSPYYPPTTVLSATRSGSTVTVSWLDIPLRRGDEEDASMLHYIVEVWRCEAGQIIFDPLATNDTSISFVDEPGCSMPSHGNVYVQEKHGFAGPTVIPWP